MMVIKYPLLSWILNYSQTCVDGHLPTKASIRPGKSNLIVILIENSLKSGHLCTTATILGVPRVAVVDRFDSTINRLN
jgi:hypothetical protein